MVLASDLDDQLVAQLRRADESAPHLAMPEVIGWADIDAFKISGLGVSPC